MKGRAETGWESNIQGLAEGKWVEGDLMVASGDGACNILEEMKANVKSRRDIACVEASITSDPNASHNVLPGGSEWSTNCRN